MLPSLEKRGGGDGIAHSFNCRAPMCLVVCVVLLADALAAIVVVVCSCC